MRVLKKGTWVLVADGEKALLMRNAGDARQIRLQVIREKHQDNPPTREQGTDRPGRSSGGGPTPVSAVENTDWHQFEKDRFADDLADLLHRRARTGAFEQLVIAADPGTLGNLRDVLHEDVGRKVVLEIPKTLTNHPVGEIEKIVEASLD